MEGIASTQWATAGAVLLGALVIGWAVAQLVGRRIHRAATLTALGFDDVIAGAVTPIIQWWFLTGGLFAAKLYLGEGLAPRYDNLMHGILVTLLVGSVTVALGRLAADAVRLYALRSSGVRSSSSLFVTLARIFVYIVGTLVLLQSLGISIAPLLAALGVGGLALALALQPTLSNLFSGVQLLASGKIRPGDYIQIEGGYEGYVEDVNWRYTTLRQLPNNEIVIPNTKLSESILTNFYLPEPEMSVRISCGVAYGSDLEHVERIAGEVAIEAMASLPNTPTFEPFVRFTEFADSSITFNVILRVTEVVDQHLVRHEFLKRLHARFQVEGIEIPFPQRVVHQAD